MGVDRTDCRSNGAARDKSPRSGAGSLPPTPPLFTCARATGLVPVPSCPELKAGRAYTYSRRLLLRFPSAAGARGARVARAAVVEGTASSTRRRARRPAPPHTVRADPGRLVGRGRGPSPPRLSTGGTWAQGEEGSWEAKGRGCLQITKSPK